MYDEIIYYKSNGWKNITDDEFINTNIKLVKQYHDKK